MEGEKFHRERYISSGSGFALIASLELRFLEFRRASAIVSAPPELHPTPHRAGWTRGYISERVLVQGGDSCSSSQPRNARSEQTLVFPTLLVHTLPLFPSRLYFHVITREGKETKGRTTSCQTGYDTGTSVRGGDEYETIQGGGRIGIFQNRGASFITGMGADGVSLSQEHTLPGVECIFPSGRAILYFNPSSARFTLRSFSLVFRGCSSRARERRRSRGGTCTPRIFRGKCEADASSGAERIRGTIPGVWKLRY